MYLSFYDTLMHTHHKHFLARLLVSAFLVLGIWFWMKSFVVVDAAVRTVGGSLSWNNQESFIDQTFWDADPTTGDIVVALYGSGSDTWTVYNTYRTWYITENCLSAGMDVVYTGEIPTSISNNTIYVIETGTYDLAAPIEMADCSALISSGTVVLSGESLIISGVDNVIIENVDVTNVAQYAIEVKGWATNFSMHSVDAWDNIGGIYISASSYGMLKDLDIAYTTNQWLTLWNSDHIYIDTINTHENSQGIITNSSNYNIFSWVLSYSNTTNWIYLNNSHFNTISNAVVHDNDQMGIINNGSNNTTMENVYTHDNTWMNIHLTSSTGNVRNNIVSNTGGSQGWISIQTSSWNIFSWIQMSGNSVVWMRLTNSHYNTWIHITSYDGTGLSLNQSTYNVFTDTLIQNSNAIWIYLYNNSNNNYLLDSTINENVYAGLVVSWSLQNQISGCVFSGNGTYGIILQDDANANTISNTTAYSGQQGIFMSNTTGNTIVQFLWTWYISEQHLSWLFQHSIYDVYTRTNNYIRFDSDFSATLTGNLVPAWEVFSPAFDVICIGTYGTGSLCLIDSNQLTISWASWDGKLYAPIQITTWSKLCGTGETSNIQIGKCIDVIEVVSGSSYLTLSGSTYYGRIQYTVWSGTSWDYLRVLKSNDGTTWTANATTSWCTLDENLFCIFDFVWDMKLFAFGVPTNLSFSGITQSALTVTSGWYYNTWVSISFTGNNISWATLNGLAYTSGSLITWDWVKTFVLTDIGGNSTWMTFVIDTTPPIVTGSYPSSGLTITGTTSIAFSWTGSDTYMSGYRLYTNSGSYATTGTSYTVSNMLNGNYTWYVIATDRAGNTWTTAVIPFTINIPLTGTMVITGTNIQYNGSTAYTKDSVSLSLWMNQSYLYLITWSDILTAALWGPLTWSVVANVLLVGGDGAKTVTGIFTNTMGDEIYKTVSVSLDTTWPTAPLLVSPWSGYISTWTLTLSWSGSTDAGVWLSWYQRYISPSSSFASITLSWYTTSTSISPNTALLGVVTGTFYRKVRALDKLGWTWESDYRDFYFSGADVTPNSFSFTTVNDASLDTVYLSNAVTITGMSTGVYSLVTINRWNLYINNQDVAGQTGLVRNGDTIKIELISSSDYDTTISSTITIGAFSTTFRITTMENDDQDVDDGIDTELSNMEKLQIIAIFFTLKDLYPDSNQQATFFNSLLNGLQEKIDELDPDVWYNRKRIDALQYFYDVIEKHIEDNNLDDPIVLDPSDRHIAPNGRVYQIVYDTATRLYNSPHFLYPKTFTTLDGIRNYININNPWLGIYQWVIAPSGGGRNHATDNTWQSAPYTAPNGKVYSLFRTTDGRYSSYSFSTAKYFINVDALKNHIYQMNK